MKDFPVFTTEHGAASLILKEIPYRKEAYIHLRATEDPEKLLEDCVSFCKICGAEHVYATGHPYLEKYPLYMSIIELRGKIVPDENKVEYIWPVTEETVSKWREIYNERMKMVDHAATLEARDEGRILNSGGAYFVHQSGELLGIGWMEDGSLLALAATVPGAGERVLHTLLSLYQEDTIVLEVASTNSRALRLYEHAGMIKTRELTCWYEV